jgi:hypothetical protein
MTSGEGVEVRLGQREERWAQREEPIARMVEEEQAGISMST